MSELTLTAQQRREWKGIAKAMREIADMDGAELDGYRYFHFTGHFETEEEEDYYRWSLFWWILFSPDQSDEYAREQIAKMRASSRWYYASLMPYFCHEAYKVAGVELFSGRSERIVQLLLEGVEGDPERFRSFEVDKALKTLSDWLTHGGSWHVPLITIINHAIECRIDMLPSVEWRMNYVSSISDSVRPAFHFKDPENLHPECSPYYAVAAHVQHYLCCEAVVPQRLERHLIEALGLNIERLSDFPLLPLLPPPDLSVLRKATEEEDQKKIGKPPKEEEVYDEIYDRSAEDWPFPPLRFHADGEFDGLTVTQWLLDRLKAKGFVSRKPSPKVMSAVPYVSYEHIENSPAKETLKAMGSRFKPHARLAMSEELELKLVVLGAKDASLPLASGAERTDRQQIQYPPFTVEQARWRVLVYVEHPNREILEDDSALLRNLLVWLCEAEQEFGITFERSTPPEALEAMEY